MDKLKKIQDQVRERVEQEAAGSASGGQDNDPITSDIIKSCLDANELGDAILLAELSRNQLVFNESTKEWMVYADHHWQIDRYNRAAAAVEKVVHKYFQEVDRIKLEINKLNGKEENKDRVSWLDKLIGKYYKRINRLRENAGINNCLSLARKIEKPLSIINDQFDSNPWLIACPNGVLDLRTGEISPGRPDQWISKACRAEYIGLDNIENKARLFRKTLLEILSDNEELFEFILRLFGYCITGLTKEHIFIVLHGQGRNGKGILMELIAHVMGDLVGPVEAEMLLDQGRSRGSTGPSPDIMMLKGLRIAFASETDENRRFSPSRVKWLSGGDTLTGRHPYDKYPSKFPPTHKLILLTNHKPHVSGDDFAFWERIRLIPFEISYVDRDPQTPKERPVDKDLFEKLKAESSEILSLLVWGCLMYQEHGLTPPQVVKDATAEYRKDEDLIAEFIEECFELGEDLFEGATEIYDRFVEWFEKNIGSKRIPKQKRFGHLMSRKFEKAKISGKYRYYGLKLLPSE